MSNPYDESAPAALRFSETPERMGAPSSGANLHVAATVSAAGVVHEVGDERQRQAANTNRGAAQTSTEESLGTAADEGNKGESAGPVPLVGQGGGLSRKQSNSSVANQQHQQQSQHQQPPQLGSSPMQHAGHERGGIGSPMPASSSNNTLREGTTPGYPTAARQEEGKEQSLGGGSGSGSKGYANSNAFPTAAGYSGQDGSISSQHHPLSARNPINVRPPKGTVNPLHREYSRAEDDAYYKYLEEKEKDLHARNNSTGRDADTEEDPRGRRGGGFNPYVSAGRPSSSSHTAGSVPSWENSYRLQSESVDRTNSTSRPPTRTTLGEGVHRGDSAGSNHSHGNRQEEHQGDTEPRSLQDPMLEPSEDYRRWQRERAKAEWRTIVPSVAQPPQSSSSLPLPQMLPTSSSSSSPNSLRIGEGYSAEGIADVKRLSMGTDRSGVENRRTTVGSHGEQTGKHGGKEEEADDAEEEGEEDDSLHPSLLPLDALRDRRKKQLDAFLLIVACSLATLRDEEILLQRCVMLGTSVNGGGGPTFSTGAANNSPVHAAIHSLSRLHGNLTTLWSPLYSSSAPTSSTSTNTSPAERRSNGKNSNAPNPQRNQFFSSAAGVIVKRASLARASGFVDYVLSAAVAEGPQSTHHSAGSDLAKSRELLATQAAIVKVLLSSLLSSAIPSSSSSSTASLFQQQQFRRMSEVCISLQRAIARLRDVCDGALPLTTATEEAIRGFSPLLMSTTPANHVPLQPDFINPSANSSSRKTARKEEEEAMAPRRGTKKDQTNNNNTNNKSYYHPKREGYAHEPSFSAPRLMLAERSLSRGERSRSAVGGTDDGLVKTARIRQNYDTSQIDADIPTDDDDDDLLLEEEDFDDGNNDDESSDEDGEKESDTDSYHRGVGSARVLEEIMSPSPRREGLPSPRRGAAAAAAASASLAYPSASASPPPPSFSLARPRSSSKGSANKREKGSNMMWAADGSSSPSSQPRRGASGRRIEASDKKGDKHTKKKNGGGDGSSSSSTISGLLKSIHDGLSLAAAASAGRGGSTMRREIDDGVRGGGYHNENEGDDRQSGGRGRGGGPLSNNTSSLALFRASSLEMAAKDVLVCAQEAVTEYEKENIRLRKDNDKLRRQLAEAHQMTADEFTSLRSAIEDERELYRTESRALVEKVRAECAREHENAMAIRDAEQQKVLNDKEEEWIARLKQAEDDAEKRLFATKSDSSKRLDRELSQRDELHALKMEKTLEKLRFKHKLEIESVEKSHAAEKKRFLEATQKMATLEQIRSETDKKLRATTRELLESKAMIETMKTQVEKEANEREAMERDLEYALTEILELKSIAANYRQQQREINASLFAEPAVSGAAAAISSSGLDHRGSVAAVPHPHRHRGGLGRVRGSTRGEAGGDDDDDDMGDDYNDQNNDTDNNNNNGTSRYYFLDAAPDESIVGAYSSPPSARLTKGGPRAAAPAVAPAVAVGHHNSTFFPEGSRDREKKNLSRRTEDNRLTEQNFGQVPIQSTRHYSIDRVGDSSYDDQNQQGAGVRGGGGSANSPVFDNSTTYTHDSGVGGAPSHTPARSLFESERSPTNALGPLRVISSSVAAAALEPTIRNYFTHDRGEEGRNNNSYNHLMTHFSTADSPPPLPSKQRQTEDFAVHSSDTNNNNRNDVSPRGIGGGGGGGWPSATGRQPQQPHDDQQRRQQQQQQQQQQQVQQHNNNNTTHHRRAKEQQHGYSDSSQQSWGGPPTQRPTSSVSTVFSAANTEQELDGIDKVIKDLNANLLFESGGDFSRIASTIGAMGGAETSSSRRSPPFTAGDAMVSSVLNNAPLDDETLHSTDAAEQRCVNGSRTEGEMREGDAYNRDNKGLLHVQSGTQHQNAQSQRQQRQQQPSSQRRSSPSPSSFSRSSTSYLSHHAQPSVPDGAHQPRHGMGSSSKREDDGDDEKGDVPSAIMTRKGGAGATRSLPRHGVVAGGAADGDGLEDDLALSPSEAYKQRRQQQTDSDPYYSNASSNNKNGSDNARATMGSSTHHHRNPQETGRYLYKDDYNDEEDHSAAAAYSSNTNNSGNHRNNNKGGGKKYPDDEDADGIFSDDSMLMGNARSAAEGEELKSPPSLFSQQQKSRQRQGADYSNDTRHMDPSYGAEKTNINPHASRGGQQRRSEELQPQQVHAQKPFAAAAAPPRELDETLSPSGATNTTTANVRLGRQKSLHHNNEGNLNTTAARLPKEVSTPAVAQGMSGRHGNTIVNNSSSAVSPNVRRALAMAAAAAAAASANASRGGSVRSEKGGHIQSSARPSSSLVSASTSVAETASLNSAAAAHVGGGPFASGGANTRHLHQEVVRHREPLPTTGLATPARQHSTANPPWSSAAVGVHNSVGYAPSPLSVRRDRLQSVLDELDQKAQTVQERRSAIGTTLLARRNQLLMSGASDGEVGQLNEQIHLTMEKVNLAMSQIKQKRDKVVAELDTVDEMLQRES